MIRSWVRAFRDEDLLGSLATLEEAIAGQGCPISVNLVPHWDGLAPPYSSCQFHHAYGGVCG